MWLTCFQDSKPPKRSKKDDAGTSKIAPVKKPKGKMVEGGYGKDPSAKTTEEFEAGRATRQKATKKGSDAPAPKPVRKGGKKAAA